MLVFRGCNAWIASTFQHPWRPNCRGLFFFIQRLEPWNQGTCSRKDASKLLLQEKSVSGVLRSEILASRTFRVHGKPPTKPLKKRWFWTDDCPTFCIERVIAEGSSGTAMPLCGSKLVQLLGRLAVKKVLNPKSPEICRSFHLKTNSFFFFALKNIGGGFFQTGKGEMDPNLA